MMKNVMKKVALVAMAAAIVAGSFVAAPVVTEGQEIEIEIEGFEFRPPAESKETGEND